MDNFVEGSLSGSGRQSLKGKLISSQISFSQQKLLFKVVRFPETLKQLKSLIYFTKWDEHKQHDPFQLSSGISTPFQS